MDWACIITGEETGQFGNDIQESIYLEDQEVDRWLNL
jgi:hypothetical protein